ADVTTRRLIEAVDLEKTFTNAIAALSPEKAALPMHFATDRECLDVCLKTIGMVPPEKTRIVRIKNTLRLDRLLVSKALEPEITSNPALKRVTSWKALTFDHMGNLPSMQP
ncbi:MAG: DUF362 domain-containing protein, partial [Deltaproteobacteria bacterium]|nr:DUF362 domain-containing protein [Deltaproteobacteria bacterium]